MFKVIISYLIIFNSINFSYAGPGNTGGGDPRSQELYSVIKSIPTVLAAKGAHLFPEINLEELSDFVNQTPIQVELDTNIRVEGKPKMSKCFADNGVFKITLDPEMWDHIGSTNNSVIAKRAHGFHEILCLMGIEKNNDYSISNRFLGIESLATVGIKAGKNQIVPKDLFSKEVIFWTESDKDKGSKTFFYCADRDNVSSCKIIGNRSYSSADLQKLLNDQAKSVKSVKDRYLVQAIVVTVAFIVGALASPAVGLISFGLMTEPVVMVALSLGFFGGLFTPAMYDTDMSKENKKEVVSILSGDMKSNESLSFLAQSLHNALIKTDSISSSTVKKVP